MTTQTPLGFGTPIFEKAFEENEFFNKKNINNNLNNHQTNIVDYKDIEIEEINNFINYDNIKKFINDKSTNPEGQQIILFDEINNEVNEYLKYILEKELKNFVFDKINYVINLKKNANAEYNYFSHCLVNNFKSKLTKLINDKNITIKVCLRKKTYNELNSYEQCKKYNPTGTRSCENFIDKLNEIGYKAKINYLGVVDEHILILDISIPENI
jgi:hypothetical protein